MTIELTDPRYAAIDQIGYALGQRYGQIRQAKKDEKSLAAWDQIKQNLNNPQYTPEELASAWKQLEQKYGQGLVGANPLEGITQSKKAWETATNDVQRDAAHQQADYYRRLADVKGLSLAGYAAGDPLKTPAYRLEAPPLWEGAQKPGQGLFGPMLDTNQEQEGLLTAGLNQGKQFLNDPGLNQNQGQGLLTSALNNQFLREPEQNLITMEDIDRASGGQLSAEAKAAALQMARQRAQAEIKSGAPATNFFRQLLRKGYDPEAAAKLMQVAGMDLKHMQEELQDTTAKDLGRQMVEATKAGDYGQATSLALQIDVRTKSNLGSNYLKTLQPKTSTYVADTGPAEILYEVNTPPLGGLVTRREVGKDTKGLTPGQVQQGKQFNQNFALDIQKLDLQRQALVQDFAERDRRFFLDVQKIQNDNARQFVAGQHELLRSLATDAGYLLKMAQEENDTNKKAQYMQTAQGLISRADQLRTSIDKTMASLVPGVASSGQTTAASGANSGGVDYYSAINSIDAALKRNATAESGVRWNRAQLEDYIRRQYGDLAPNLINDIDWKSYGM